MRNAILVLLLSVACSVRATEYYCNGCGGRLLRTDTFCTKCGAKITVWPDMHPSQPTKEKKYTPVSGIPEDLPKSDLKTPLKISIVDVLALPWDRHCTVYGLHLAALGDSCHSIYGISACGIAMTCHTLGGIGVAMFNLAHVACGIQVGFFNAADELDGLQIGAINMAGRGKTKGVQIGVINQIGMKDEGWFMPVINMCF
jgi:hypothetical protein